MSEDTTTNESETPKTKKGTKKKPQRKPLWLLVPTDIEDLDVTDVEVPAPPEPDEEGKRDNVEAVEMESEYFVYAIPGGPGQKKEVKRILAKHNVDLRTISRVHMFSGEKSFRVETQYNIRF